MTEQNVNPYEGSRLASSHRGNNSAPLIIAGGSFCMAAIIVLGSLWLGWWGWIITDPSAISLSEWGLLSATGSVALAFVGVGIGVWARRQRLTLVCLCPIMATIFFLIGLLLI